MPGIDALRTYKREWLGPDVVAGVVLVAILVPQGMAYAELAGLPAVTGLYTTMACLVGYAVDGSIAVLVLGPDSPARVIDIRGDRTTRGCLGGSGDRRSSSPG